MNLQLDLMNLNYKPHYKEKFKFIKGYNQEYVISDHGCIISYKYPTKPRLMKISVTNSGYNQVYLNHKTDSKLRKQYLVHQLVYDNFSDNLQYTELGFIDGNKMNLHIDNLIPRSSHKESVNLAKNQPETKKPIIVTDTHTNLEYEFESLQEVSKSYNVHQSQISMVCRGKQYTFLKKRYSCRFK